MVDIDVSKIKWRQVTREQYDYSDGLLPRRFTRLSNDIVQYELGTLPLELPTKPGAIVAPKSPNLEGYVPYVRGTDGDWYEVGNSWTSAESDVLKFLEDDEFYIAFGGYDE